MTSSSSDRTARPSAELEALASHLMDDDWVVRPDFLSAARIAALRREAEGLRAAGGFRAAGIGKSGERRADVRGDEICWLEAEAVAMLEATRLLRGELAELRQALNAATFLGLQDFEGHYAAYPAGASYARHLDRFRDDDRRVISLVLYLNDDWGEADGGELCLHADTPVSILPRGGTLVCFLSECVPHEVMAARRTRLSLTGWFRRRA